MGVRPLCNVARTLRYCGSRHPIRWEQQGILQSLFEIISKTRLTPLPIGPIGARATKIPGMTVYVAYVTVAIPLPSTCLDAPTPVRVSRVVRQLEWSWGLIYSDLGLSDWVLQSIGSCSVAQPPGRGLRQAACRVLCAFTNAFAHSCSLISRKIDRLLVPFCTLYRVWRLNRPDMGSRVSRSGHTGCWRT